MTNRISQYRSQCGGRCSNRRSARWPFAFRAFFLLIAVAVFAGDVAQAASAGEHGGSATQRAFVAGAVRTSDGGAGECLRASGARVRAGELARQDPRFAMLASDTDLGFVPDPGKQREIQVPGHVAAGQPAADAEATAAEFHVPPTVCVERAQRPLSRELLRAAIPAEAFAMGRPSESVLPTAGGRNPVVPVGDAGGGTRITVLAWQEGSFPEGRIHLPVRGIVAPVRGVDELLWRGSVEYESGRSMAFWVRVRVEREVPCARWKKGVRRGQPVASAETEAVACDAAAILAGALQGLEQIRAVQKVPLVAAHDLRAGEWLLASDLTVAPTLRRGDFLALRVVSGGVALALPVVAEQAGAVGERIWVRTVERSGPSGEASVRKRMRAIVTGPGSARMDMGTASASR